MANPGDRLTGFSQTSASLLIRCVSLEISVNFLPIKCTCFRKIIQDWHESLRQVECVMQILFFVLLFKNIPFRQWEHLYLMICLTYIALQQTNNNNKKPRLDMWAIYLVQQTTPWAQLSSSSICEIKFYWNTAHDHSLCIFYDYFCTIN